MGLGVQIPHPRGIQKLIPHPHGGGDPIPHGVPMGGGGGAQTLVFNRCGIMYDYKIIHWMLLLLKVTLIYSVPHIFHDQ